MILFLVRRDKRVVIMSASDREAAKRMSFVYLKGNPDQYVVSPITEEGDLVCIEVMVHNGPPVASRG